MDVKKRLQFIEAKDRLLTLSKITDIVRGSEAIQSNNLAIEQLDVITSSIFNALTILETEEHDFLVQEEKRVLKTEEDD